LPPTVAAAPMSARAGATPARQAATGRSDYVSGVVAAHERYQGVGGRAWEDEGMPNGRVASAPCTPARGRVQATPHSVPSGVGGGTWARLMPSAATSDLASAWAEVEQVRLSLLQRARELSQREGAVRRAEARNTAAAQQLGELRHRLDDYSSELEQGVAALTAQQEAVREERRQTLEMQARVRRMCAAAVRDDVVASKGRDWHRVWPPTQLMGP
jgi:hypothetical protein